MKLWALPLVFMLAACAGLQAVPSSPIRFVHLTHPASGERVQVTYFQNGRYDPQALQQVSRLLRDRRSGAVHPVQPALLDFLVDLRARLLLPAETPFAINSGFRSPDSQAFLIRSGATQARDSWHLSGGAVDFRVPGFSSRAVAEVAKTMQRGGVAYYARTDHVHLDVGHVRSWRTN